MLNPASTEHRTAEAAPSELYGATLRREYAQQPDGHSLGTAVPESDLAGPTTLIEPTTALALLIAGIGLWLYRVARRIR